MLRNNRLFSLYMSVLYGIQKHGVIALPSKYCEYYSGEKYFKGWLRFLNDFYSILWRTLIFNHYANLGGMPSSATFLWITLYIFKFYETRTSSEINNIWLSRCGAFDFGNIKSTKSFQIPHSYTPIRSYPLSKPQGQRGEERPFNIKHI